MNQTPHSHGPSEEGVEVAAISVAILPGSQTQLSNLGLGTKPRAKGLAEAKRNGRGVLFNAIASGLSKP
jgi:hypothetical protein